MSKPTTFDGIDRFVEMQTEQGRIIGSLTSRNVVLSWLGMLFLLIRHEPESRRAARTIRSMLNLCHEDCQGVSCALRFCPAIFTIRDNYRKLIAVGSSHLTFWPFRAIMRKSLEEWDDLAEDCSLITNPEIHTALARIDCHLKRHSVRIPDWRDSMAGIL